MIEADREGKCECNGSEPPAVTAEERQVGALHAGTAGAKSDDGSTGEGGSPNSQSEPSCPSLSQQSDDALQSAQQPKEKCASADKKYVCMWEDCTEEFADPEQFSAHIESHMNFPPWRCKWRGCIHRTVCDHRSNLFQHVLMHTNYRPYKCDVPGCDYSAPFSWSLRRHTEAHIRTGIFNGPVPRRRKAAAAAAAASMAYAMDENLSVQAQHLMAQLSAQTNSVDLTTGKKTFRSRKDCAPKTKVLKTQAARIQQQRPKSAELASNFPNLLNTSAFGPMNYNGVLLHSPLLSQVSPAVTYSYPTAIVSPEILPQCCSYTGFTPQSVPTSAAVGVPCANNGTIPPLNTALPFTCPVATRDDNDELDLPPIDKICLNSPVLQSQKINGSLLNQQQQQQQLFTPIKIENIMAQHVSESTKQKDDTNNAFLSCSTPQQDTAMDTEQPVPSKKISVKDLYWQ